MRTRLKGLPAVALCAVFLSTGCMLGQDYQRPEVPEEQKFRHQEEAELDPKSLADLPWWELFRDPHLQAHIRAALEENKDLLLATARVDELRAQIGIVQGELFPQLAGSAEAMHRRIPGTLIPGISQDTKLEKEIYSLQGFLSWELDLWGRLRRATEAAKAEFIAVEHARQGVLLSLVSHVAEAYFDLRALDLELEVTRRTLESRRKYFQIVNDRYKDGLASGLEVTKAEAEVAKLSARVPNLERQVAMQENALSILLGRNPAGIGRGLTLTEQTLPPVIPAGLPSWLLERRPDIRQAEQQLVAANAQVGVAKAEFFPKISLTGNYGVLSRELDDLFIGPAQIWGIGPSMSVPLFTGGKLQSNLEATDARKQQALIRYRQVVQQSFREVDDALVTHQKVRESRQELEKFVTSNRKALQLAEYRYEEGLSDYIDVVDAQRQLYDSEIDLARTQQVQLVSVVQLYKALGGGWQGESPP
jgi:multidrug efflux system outer membrane protein